MVHDQSYQTRRFRRLSRGAIAACALVIACAIVALSPALSQAPPDAAANSRTIRTGERLRISIVGLLGEGVETRVTRIVDPDGRLRLPKLDASKLSLHVPASVSVGRALQMVLDTAASGIANLRYDWIDDVLIVSTSEGMSRRRETMVVNVAPLLNEAGRDDLAAREEQIDQIIDTITETVASDMWQTNGGAAGTIQCVDDQLVIAATPWMLREALVLLGRLAK